MWLVLVSTVFLLDPSGLENDGAPFWDNRTWLSFVSVRDPSMLLLLDFLNILLRLLLLVILLLAVVVLLLLPLASALEVPFRLGTVDIASTSSRRETVLITTCRLPS